MDREVVTSENNGMPLISVITVCYNCAADLERTIISVINQTYFNIEYIIIDGGSSDNTKDIIKKYESGIDYWISERDFGVYDAMNKGLARATGRWVNFMNAGDIFYNNAVISDLDFPCKVPGTLIYGDFLALKPDGKIVELCITPFFKTYFKYNRVGICHQTIFYPTKKIQTLYYDLRYKICADYDLTYKLWKQNITFYHVNTVVAIYQYGNGISSKRENWYKGLLENAQIVGQQYNVFFMCKYVVLFVISVIDKLLKCNGR